MKSARKIFTLLLAFVIAIGSIMWIRDNVPARAAVENEHKLVCNVKQLKKAMKEKQATTIIFRTETYNNITIPSVKAAKNKKIYIFAPNSAVTNKSGFETVTVKSAKSYTEAAKGNTIFWDIIYTDQLTIAKGKIVNKLVLTNWLEQEPYFTVREGAKVKAIEIDTEGYKSTVDKQNRAITVSWDDKGSPVTATYEFNKFGRLIKMSGTNLIRKGNYNTTYEYDKNGNLTKQNFLAPTSKTITYEYNSDNNLIKVIESKSGEKDNITYYEYDSNGNRNYISGVVPINDVDYVLRPVYDDKGKIISAKNITYVYDSEGRLTDYKNENSSDGYWIKYYYDKTGFLTKIIYGSEYGDYAVYEYSNDFLGNRIFEINRYEDEQGYSDNRYRTLHELFECIEDYPVYEDGFVSPVKKNLTNKSEYEEAGYCVVTDTDEFLDAIEPDAKIILACSVDLGFCSDYYGFDIEAFNKSHKYVQFIKNKDGYDFVITGVDNLLISGGNIKGASSAIYTSPGYVTALRFVDCNGLKLNSFGCSHGSYIDVSANVIEFYNCTDVGLYNMRIRESLYGIAAYDMCGNIRIYNSVFQAYKGLCYFSELDDDNVLFANCIFERTGSGGVIDQTSKYYPNVTFKRCTFGEEESKENAFIGNFNFVECLWCSR